MSTTLCMAILGGSSFVLTLLFWYVAWTRMRVVRLRGDLRRYEFDLRSVATAKGREDDAYYRHLLLVIRGFDRYAGMISAATTLYMLVIHKKMHGEIQEPQWPDCDPEFRVILEAHSQRIHRRLSNYLGYETVGGATAVLLLQFLPKRVRRQVGADAVESLDPIECLAPA